LGESRKIGRRVGMAAKLITNDGKKYAGKFVATGSFNDKTVIAAGKDPLKVREKAINNGHKSPVVFFIPDKNSMHIY
jgi:hypothetical protein